MATRFCLSLLALGAAWASVAGCGGDGDDGGAPVGGPSGGPEAIALPYEPCAPENDVGEFVIELASDFTSVSGKVSDGIVPIQVPVEVMTEGACRLVTPPTLLCDPDCAFSTQTCGASNMCIPLPRSHDLGVVTVYGMAVPLEMNPNAATKNYTNPASARLPSPGFEAGADLRITTSGGDYEPFELRGWGVSLMEVTADPITVRQGSPTTVTWRVPAEVGPARVNVNLNVNNHGSNTAWIECDFPDTGLAEIPATLIDGLIEQGLSGFPTMTLTRRTANSVLIAPGCVELLVISKVSIDIEVDGITSCDDDSSVCPGGQTCVPVEMFCQ